MQSGSSPHTPNSRAAESRVSRLLPCRSNRIGSLGAQNCDRQYSLPQGLMQISINERGRLFPKNPVNVSAGD
jgi:hypothetical protein